MFSGLPRLLLQTYRVFLLTGRKWQSFEGLSLMASRAVAAVAFLQTKRGHQVQFGTDALLASADWAVQAAAKHGH